MQNSVPGARAVLQNMGGGLLRAHGSAIQSGQDESPATLSYRPLSAAGNGLRSGDLAHQSYHDAEDFQRAFRSYDRIRLVLRT